MFTFTLSLTNTKLIMGTKNTMKPKEEKGKGFDEEEYKKVKDELRKRKIVSFRLTENEGEVFDLLRGPLSESAYMRELIKKDKELKKLKL